MDYIIDNLPIYGMYFLAALTLGGLGLGSALAGMHVVRERRHGLGACLGCSAAIFLLGAALITLVVLLPLAMWILFYPEVEV